MIPVDVSGIGTEFHLAQLLNLVICLRIQATLGDRMVYCNFLCWRI
ncbi:hypothetical protein CI610_03064 [invertebrate metagenome]|uniref:Uncharacterized protein n=1 Tax=invertebrate metagenome TaxID=1711999 RepID=A0A2H9T485_9ZZZZ